MVPAEVRQVLIHINNDNNDNNPTPLFHYLSFFLSNTVYLRLEVRRLLAEEPPLLYSLKVVGTWCECV